MKALLSVLIVLAIAMPLCADTTVLSENFNGTAATDINGWNGWAGANGLVISSNLLDAGNSAAWSGGTAAWTEDLKSFSYTPVR